MGDKLRGLTEELRKKIDKVSRVLDRNVPIAIGKTAVDHFRQNFRLGGFRNGGVKKWDDVKRRDKGSPWFGFEYKGEKRTFLKLTRDRKTGKTSRAKKQDKLNFSPTATIREPLSSKRMELFNSIRYIPGQGTVEIVSDKPYARVQNEGGTIKVFGKHPVKLPARPFMGESEELTGEVTREIDKQVTKILEA